VVARLILDLTHHGLEIPDDQRLEHAREELLDPRLTRRSVAAIAHGNGFGDISGFNRAFKAAYGVSPRDLRAVPRRS
jgi:AraC-like DNA-binding protein